MSTQKEYSVEELIAEASSLIKSLKKDDMDAKPEDKDAMQSPEAPSPEASAPAEASPAAPAPAAPEMSQAAPAQEQSPVDQLAAEPAEQQQEDLGSLVQSLEDDQLQELAEVISQELEMRHSQSQPADAAPEQAMDASPAAPAQEQSQPAAPEASAVKPEEVSAFKAEIEAIKDQLKKSEDQNKKLMDFVGKTTETLAKAASMPKPKAVTNIDDVKFVENGLKKSEATEKDAHDKLQAMGKDMKVLKSLSKRELGDLNGYYQSKQLNDKVLKLINK